jgi:hypothetical protein
VIRDRRYFRNTLLFSIALLLPARARHASLVARRRSSRVGGYHHRTLAAAAPARAPRELSSPAVFARHHAFARRLARR